MSESYVTLKDFRPGQTAYIVEIELLEYRRAKDNSKIIVETTVEKTGRKYVRANGRKFAEEPEAKYGEDGLIEQVNYGHYAVLTPNQQTAQQIVRRSQLSHKILGMCDINRLQSLSLERLEQIHELLSV